VAYSSLYTNPQMTSGSGGTRTYDWGAGVSYTLTPVQIQTSWGSFTNYQQTWSVSAPAAAPAPALDNNVSVSVYGKIIPISAGRRRVPGDIIWLEDDQLNTEGDYTAHAAYGQGYRLLEATSAIAKIWANGQIMYNALTGFIADGFVLEAQYDGSQTTYDPEIAADRGADITSAWKEQLYYRGLHPTKEFGATLPNISVLWIDEAGGSLFLPWGGAWDVANKSANIDLTNSDLTATVDVDNTASGVRSTVSHSSGRWFFGIRRDASGATDFGGVTAWRWGFRTDVSTAGYNYHLGQSGAQSLCYDINGGILTNGLGAGSAFCDQVCTLGDYIWIAVDLDELVFWVSADASTFSGPTPLTGDPVIGTNPLTSLQESFLGSPTEYFIAFSGFDSGDAVTLITDEFPVTPPGVAGSLTLINVILAVAERCGLTESDFTFVGLDDILVTGIVITTKTDFRAFLQNMGRAYGFDYTVSGGRILCKKSVIASTYTLDHTFEPSQLVAISDEATTQTTRDDTVQYPTVQEYSYQDETIDYQPSMQRARREEARVHITDSFAVPVVQNATEALTSATTALFREWQQRFTHSLELPFLGLNVEPTDIIEFTADGRVYTCKVTNVVRNSDLSVNLSVVNLLTAEADLRTIDGEYQGGEYAGEGYSGEPNINNLPMEIPFAGGMDFSVAENSGYVVVISGQ
jgi:hypothetical protein